MSESTMTTKVVELPTRINIQPQVEAFAEKKYGGLGCPDYPVSDWKNSSET